MKKLAGLLVAVGLILPGLALAQGPPGPPMAGPPPGGRMMARQHAGPFGTWWRDSEIAKQLELTPDQTKQIEQTFLESRLKLIDQRADLDKQETLLRSMMGEDRPDEAKVSAQLDKVIAARGRLEKENAMMMLSIRRVLSVDQWKKLQTLQRERERMGAMWMRRGPGRGPSLPPPPRRPADGPEA